MVAKKTAATKAPAKKAAAKKTVAKTTAAKTPTVAERRATKQAVAEAVTATPNPVVATADPSGLQPEDSKSPESIANDILNGSKRWGTGRDRVALLKSAGHDPEAVRKAVNRLRGRRRSS